MAKIPDVIYLQWEGDGDGETTWCVDMINDDDIAYVLKEAAEARADRLEKYLREAMRLCPFVKRVATDENWMNWEVEVDRSLYKPPDDHHGEQGRMGDDG